MRALASDCLRIPYTANKLADGFARQVYLINGQQPGPLIEANQGDILEVTVFNDLDVENTIHWHGLLQRGTPDMDGVPGVTQFAIPPGGNFTYHMPLGDQYGFYWYHSHFKSYYNDAIRGPLLIHPSPSLRRPFQSLAQTEAEESALLQAEKDATPLLLADWYHDPSNAVYQQYFRTGAFPGCVDSLLANGHGRVQCLPNNLLMAGPGLDLNITSSEVASKASSMSHSMDSGSTMASCVNNCATTTDAMSMNPTASMSMAMMRRATSTVELIADKAEGGMEMSSLNALGCTPPMMFNPGYSIDSLPPVTCTNTTAALLTITKIRSQGWLALHLVNAAATSKLQVSLDAHTMFVFAADGLYVEMQEVKVLPIAIGQRYSVMIRLNQPPGQYYLRFASYPVGDMQQVIQDQVIVDISDGRHDNNNTSCDKPQSTWMLLNGSAKAQASVLNEKLLAPLLPNMPPTAPADITRIFTINQTAPVVWVVDKAPYTEAKTPVLHGNRSDGWTANTTLHMPSNSTIDIIMQIADASMDTMGHPMHLHGHKFWILGTGTGSLPFSSVMNASPSVINMHDPPYRDTVELPAAGWAAIRQASSRLLSTFLPMN
ncbi:hypothetical protein LTR78_010966 [Recurvomyces mirabilis]|uniref:Laccase n=1 Tax=Recurvomyces mirabilis TaxID=574656 RepID=A0AAE0TPH5_9PEZI|nr:hypothetical protein LTR78_010966 [Recurvomyces mirabilis]KAK5149852.1 hypothetical protein LTS14_010567 [Recurvomyces mirabilis]